MFLCESQEPPPKGFVGSQGYSHFLPQEYKLQTVLLEKAVGPGRCGRKGGASLWDVSSNGQRLLRTGARGVSGWGGEQHTLPGSLEVAEGRKLCPGEGGRGSSALAPPRTLWAPAPVTLVAGDEPAGEEPQHLEVFE